MIDVKGMLESIIRAHKYQKNFEDKVREFLRMRISVYMSFASCTVEVMRRHGFNDVKIDVELKTAEDGRTYSRILIYEPDDNVEIDRWLFLNEMLRETLPKYELKEIGINENFDTKFFLQVDY